MREKSLALNWQPNYLISQKFLKKNWEMYLQSSSGCEFRKNGDVFVRFSQIADSAELTKVSQICENAWLEEIDEKRQSAIDAGISEIDFEREMCKRDLYYLGKYILGYDKGVFHLHYFMCQTMQNLPLGYRGLREFPRDTYKTTFLGISFIIQQVLIDKNIRICWKSNNATNAKNKIKEAKQHFIDGPILSRLFPEHRPNKVKEEGSGSVWITPARTAPQQEGTFTASGVGASSASQHYHIVLGDDFWDEFSVESKEMSSKIEKAITNIDFLLTATDSDRIIYIGTRFSLDDPTETFVKSWESEEYKKLQKERSRFFPACIIASGITKLGRMIFPEQMSLETSFNQYNKDSYGFSCHIMLNPSREDSSFKQEWFKYITKQEIRQLEIKNQVATRTVILTDATGTDKGDPIAILAIKILSDKRYCVVEYIRKKVAPAEFLDLVFGIYDKYKAEYVVSQKAPLEVALKSFVEERNKVRSSQGKARVRFYNLSLKKASKTSRMGALQPYFQQGQIWFDPNCENIEMLEQEILSFPVSNNDDGMDALSEITDEVVGRFPSGKGIERKRKEIEDNLVSYRPADIERDWRREQTKKIFNKSKKKEWLCL